MGILIPKPKVGTIFRNIEEYSGIFKNIQEYSIIFRNIQEYSGIFRNIQEYLRNIQEYSGIFQNIPEYSRIFRNIQEYSGIFRNIQEYSGIKMGVIFFFYSVQGVGVVVVGGYRRRAVTHCIVASTMQGNITPFRRNNLYSNKKKLKN